MDHGLERIEAYGTEVAGELVANPAFARDIPAIVGSSGNFQGTKWSVEVQAHSRFWPFIFGRLPTRLDHSLAFMLTEFRLCGGQQTVQGVCLAEYLPCRITSCTRRYWISTVHGTDHPKRLPIMEWSKNMGVAAHG